MSSKIVLFFVTHTLLQRFSYHILAVKDLPTFVCTTTIFYFLTTVSSEECNSANPSTWQCEDFHYNFVFHHGEHLEETLKCIQYDKYKPPTRKDSQPIVVEANINVKKLVALNIDLLVSM